MDLTAVLNRLRKQKLFAKMFKCAFRLPEIDSVGFRVGRERIKTQPEKLKALKEWPTPQNVKDVNNSQASPTLPKICPQLRQYHISNI